MATQKKDPPALGQWAERGLADSMIGAVLSGYKIAKRLSEGSFGTVYLAEKQGLGKNFAVKVLKREFSQGRPEIVARFWYEIQLAKLSHQNIVSIIDWGTCPTGEYYYVMEYIDGQSLAHILQAGRLPYHDIREIAPQILRALGHAHKHHVVHRDLKPENVMVQRTTGEFPAVTVLDFGIAKINDPEITGGNKFTVMGDLMGTPEYMAPEIATGAEATHLSDIYSFGVVLFRMVTGKLPFRGDNPLATVNQHVNEVPPSPKTLREDTPQKLEELILRCLAKKPEVRPQSALEIIQLLEKSLFGVVDLSRTPTMPYAAASLRAQKPAIEEVHTMDAPTRERPFWPTPVTHPEVVIAADTKPDSGPPAAHPAKRRNLRTVVIVAGAVAVVGYFLSPFLIPGKKGTERAESRRAAPSVSPPREAAVVVEPSEPESQISSLKSRPATPPRADERSLLHQQCTDALSSGTGFRVGEVCDRYLALAPDDASVRVMRDFLRKRGGRRGKR